MQFWQVCCFNERVVSIASELLWWACGFTRLAVSAGALFRQCWLAQSREASNHHTDIYFAVIRFFFLHAVRNLLCCDWILLLTVCKKLILLWLDSSSYVLWEADSVMIEFFFLQSLKSLLCCDWVLLVTVCKKLILLWLSSSSYSIQETCFVIIELFFLLCVRSLLGCDWVLTVCKKLALLWLSFSYCV
jgi:hypothetical protein